LKESAKKNSALPVVETQDKKLAIIEKAGELVRVGGVRPVAEYSGKISLRIPKSLHKKLAEEAKEEGVSLNQYALYKLSR